MGRRYEISEEAANTFILNCVDLCIREKTRRNIHPTLPNGMHATEKEVDPTWSIPDFLEISSLR
jgi:hypothetical protein